MEHICARYFESDDKRGRPSVAPGVYFRMLFVGYFEGIESERGLEWRCAEARAGIGRYFAFYNHERPHQALGYQTPDAFYRGARTRAA